MSRLMNRLSLWPLRHRYLRVSRRWLSQPTKSKIVIVYGSQTGTAEAFANDLEFDADECDVDTELIDAKDFTAHDMVAKYSSPNNLVALIMASYGEGEPTDNAKSFMASILNAEQDKANFGACNYTVFGLGNSQCFPDRYNIVAKSLDERLKSLGANQVVDLGLGDASGDMSSEFEIWKEKVLSTASKRITTNDLTTESPLIEVDSTCDTENEREPQGESSRMLSEMPNFLSLSSADSPILSSRQLALVPSGRIALLATVSSIIERFNHTDEFTSAVSITFDLEDCKVYGASDDIPKIEYRNFTSNLKAGDHIGVFSPNSSMIIRRFIANINYSDVELAQLFDEFQAKGDATSLHDILRWQVQLSGAVPITTLKILHRWAKSVAALRSEAYLLELISNYDTHVRNRGLGITSVLAGICNPRKGTWEPLPISAIIKSLPAISPRLYSITNDPEYDTESVTLLCRLLRYRDCASGSLVSGLCSSYLCEGLTSSDRALIFFRESNFHLPADPSTPVILICGGSGLAPFLSFLESRSNFLKHKPSSELGPAFLYFGCRNENEYMFRSELQHYLENGSLTKLVVAFSDNIPVGNIETNHIHEEICNERCNITDKVVDDTSVHLKNLVQRGANIYVCGGAGHFGRAVRDSVDTLVRMSIPSLGMSDGTGTDSHGFGVRFMVNEKRYFEDLAD